MRLRHLMLFLLLPFPALAQAGSLRGSLSDAVTGQPLAEVRVTASSPQLERVVMTDETGGYALPELPPGLYRLTFERESFQRHTRADIQLRAGRHTRVNVELLPAGVRAPEATHPPIEVNEPGFRLSSDFVRANIVLRPRAREAAVRAFVSLAELAPRADVTVFAVSSEVPESVYIIDGLDPDDLGCGAIEAHSHDEHGPEWTRAYPEMVRPTGLPHALHMYPTDGLRER